MVPIDADIRVIGPDHPWVSRGGIKLAAALDAFGIDATDRDRASTSARRPAASPTCGCNAARAT